MKKVARMRLPSNISEDMAHNQHTSSHSSNSEPIVRTTGRIKKPKAVFDPSDNYLPRAQRTTIAGTTSLQTSSSLERRASYTKASTLSPVGTAEPKDACTVCNKQKSKRPQFANKNPLIACQECQRKIHKQCLSVDFEDFESLQRNYKCHQCTICRICNDKFTSDEEEMITCSKCTKSFHIVCFPTKVVKTDNMRDWKCNKCQVYYNQITNGTILPVKTIREIIGGGEPAIPSNSEKVVASTAEKPTVEDCSSEVKPSTPPASAQKRFSTEQNTNEDDNEKIHNEEPNTPPEKRKKELIQSPETISAETESLKTPSKSESTANCYTPNENFDEMPDVKEWSVGQVYEYFYKHFPKEAHVFKDEEIDGRSLLLLKRSDIVKKLPIKLGPSLRIYGLVLKLQAQLNDSTLGWHCGL